MAPERITLSTADDLAGDNIKRWPGVELRGNKHYHDVGPACPINPEPDPERPHRRITSLPGPGDWSPAARWMAGDYVRDNLADLATADLGDVRRMVAKGAEEVLEATSARGTAVHHYAEWRTLGQPIDWDYLKRAGALPWLPAVDNYLRDHPPVDQWCEVRVFDPQLGIAGTVDVIRWLTEHRVRIVDYKSRSSRHDKRASEAGQLGAYARAAMLGYIVDERGRRRRVQEVDSLAVVTFCPDGTYAIHELDVAEAIAAHEGRMTVVESVEWSTTRSKPLDVPAVIGERLAALEPPARNALGKRWQEHDLPKVADLTLDDWVLADRLMTAAEPQPEPAPTQYATIKECAAVADRIQALPEDLRALVKQSGGGLRSPLAAVVTVEELEDWDRLIVPAEATAARRPGQAMLLLETVADEVGEAILCAINVRNALWTDADLDRCAELVAAINAGHLIVTDGQLVAATVDLPKRETVATAKQIAAAIGRPKPTRFADVLADVVVYAAVLAA